MALSIKDNARVCRDSPFGSCAAVASAPQLKARQGEQLKGLVVIFQNDRIAVRSPVPLLFRSPFRTSIQEPARSPGQNGKRPPNGRPVA